MGLELRIALVPEAVVAQIKSNQFTGLNNSTCAPKTIYIRTMSGIRSNYVRENGAPVGIQAILEAGHCLSFSDVWRQSVPRSGRTNSISRFPPGKVKTWLTDLEVVPSEVTSSWRFKNLIRRQFQVTIEQLVHLDECRTENLSLKRGAFEFVNA